VDSDAAFQEDTSPDGQCFLMINKQINVGKEVAYYTFISKKIIADAGRENGGNIAIDFDPNFERLNIHRVQIIRGNKQLDRFDRKKVALQQRQERPDARIYDGTITFAMILKDVRVGDVINYSYTIIGYNPALNNHFYHEFIVASLWPIARMEYRLIFPTDRQLYFKNFQTQIQPQIQSTQEYLEYRWSLAEIQGIMPDHELPIWYEPFPYIQICEARDWQDVCRQILPVYEPHFGATAPIKALALEIAGRQSTPESQCLEALRFVQDKIRFSDIIYGAKSYVPTAPAIVLERRLGDSKDKSLLLVSLL
jgi:transglutaminase-like putative cysteine protease